MCFVGDWPGSFIHSPSLRQHFLTHKTLNPLQGCMQGCIVYCQHRIISTSSQGEAADYRVHGGRAAGGGCWVLQPQTGTAVLTKPEHAAFRKRLVWICCILTNSVWECKACGYIHSQLINPAPHDNPRGLSSNTQVCSAVLWSSILREIYESCVPGSTTPAQLSRLTQPQCPRTCWVIMRTSHEPSRESFLSEVTWTS